MSPPEPSGSARVTNNREEIKVASKQRSLGDVLQEFANQRRIMQQELQKVIVGQDEVIEQVFAAIFTRGHCLLEGVPGLAKTLMVSTLAKILDVGFNRIQFTPDLMPSDITGTNVLDEDEQGRRQFRFVEGPIFTNILLADEINRTPPKTQAALLQAMQEREVTVGRTTYDLPDPFFTIATQNPIEQEGTYPLPEAQLDRFLMLVKIDYPAVEAERDILNLVRNEAANVEGQAPDQVAQADLFSARQEVLAMHMAPEVEEYIIQLVMATRKPELYGDDLNAWLEYGASPRGTISLDRCARAHSWIQGRDFVSPDDVQEILFDVLRHRILLSFEAEASGITPDHVLETIRERVPSA